MSPCPTPAGRTFPGAACRRRRGAPGGDLLVELDAQARGARRDDVSLLPADRLLQDLGVEAAPGLDALLDQEVGRAGADLDVGGAFDGAAIEVRRDLGEVGLGQNKGDSPFPPRT